MSDYTRFAIYYLPKGDDLATFGASWLGWDVNSGADVAHPEVEGVAELTDRPRKYGFHGTLKPPFRLAEGTDRAGLEAAVADLAARLPVGVCDALVLKSLGKFLALVPEGDAAGIARVAGACVTELDRFRAPAGEAELARRRAAGLTAQEEAYLTEWGYPYVLDVFRFHLTLTGPVEKDKIAAVEARIAGALPPLPAPFRLDAIALVGERPDTKFELIRHYALSG